METVAAPIKIIETDDYSYNTETGLYTPKERHLVNMSEFTEAARHFKKHGKYTLLSPVYDEREYREFWQNERRKRIEGVSIGGVRITGEHYGFLNYAPILRTVDPKDTREILKSNPHSRAGKKERDFPDIWDGHRKWYIAKEFARQQGLHVVGGKARRKGYSYVGAWDATNDYDLYPEMTIIIGAFDSKYLTKGDGTMTMAKRFMDFLNKNTPWRKRRLVNARDHVKSGYKNRGLDEEYGFLSQILALSFQNNPDAAIGKDAYKILLEELGRFPNLKSVLDMTLPTMEDGTKRTGQIIGWGTGGTKGGNWVEFEELFNNPKSFGFLAFDNVFEEGLRGTSIGFWFPHIQNLVGCIDENGNSDLVAAKKDSDEERAKYKANATDFSDYTNYVAQRANVPSEAFSRSQTNIFSSAELTAWINRVKRDPAIINLSRKGQFVYNDKGKLVFLTNDVLEIEGIKTHPVITEWPHKAGNDNHGCFQMWQPPFRDPRTGIIPKDLYRIWVDPVAHDKDKEKITAKDSLCGIYVYERPNNFTPSRGDIIVGSFVGRPESVNELNEIAIRAAIYYGNYDQSIMFENDRGTLKEYATQVRKLHLLAFEPDMMWRKDVQSDKTGRNYGIMINLKRKGIGIVYLKDWVYEQRGTDRNGTKIMNLHYIYDLGLLMEMEKHDLLRNFDRISTMVVGQYDMKEEYHKQVTLPTPEKPNGFFKRTLFSNS